MIKPGIKLQSSYTKCVILLWLVPTIPLTECVCNRQECPVTGVGSRYRKAVIVSRPPFYTGVGSKYWEALAMRVRAELLILQKSKGQSFTVDNKGCWRHSCELSGRPVRPGLASHQTERARAGMRDKPGPEPKHSVWPRRLKGKEYCHGTAGGQSLAVDKPEASGMLKPCKQRK